MAYLKRFAQDRKSFVLVEAWSLVIEHAHYSIFSDLAESDEKEGCVGANFAGSLNESANISL